MIRWIGFVLVVSGAAATGMTMAANVKRTVNLLREWVNILREMRSEIEFHLTPLGELCGILADGASAPIKNILYSVEKKLSDVPGRPAGIQMRESLSVNGQGIPVELKKIIIDLFDALGRQDVYAQIRAIDMAQQRTQSALQSLESEKKDRCRTYRVISVCAGIAIAVILI